MKLRAKLIIVFLLLSVVPLTGIVLFSYWTSRQAMEATLEAEADAMTRDLELRMDTMRRDLERGVRRVGPGLMRALAQASDRGEELTEETLERLLADMGENASLIESFTVLPYEPGAAPAPPEGPPGPSGPSGGPPDAVDGVVPPRPPKAPAAWRVDVQRLIDEAGAEGGVVGEEAARFGLGVGMAIVQGLADAGLEELLAERAQDDAERAARHAEQVQRRRAREAERNERMRAIAQRIENRFGPSEAPESGPVLAPDRELQLMGIDMDTVVRDGGRVLGQLAPKIRSEAVMNRVLAQADRRRGEVPFALDAEGTLFVADEADREALDRLDLTFATASTPSSEAVIPVRDAGDGTAGSTESTVTRAGDWLVVQSHDPRSELRFGIARPLGELLGGVRQAALRNFVAGLGLIAVALLGILPLSRRMTRNLEAVTAGAERLAAGELDTEVPVEGRDEIGQLAATFNRMTHDLRSNQARLVEQQLDQRLLEVELAHKNEELEEARRFQLGMLPDRVPAHPRYEIAVAMRTATEVGGDYYDFRLEGDDLVVAIGDATGHGATAGRMVTVVKTLLTAHGALDQPATFLRGANRAVQRMSLGRMAMALALARLHADGLTLAAAGMPPALVYRAEDGRVDELTTPGMPLGGLDFAYRAVDIALAPGDLVLMMSDGYPELPDAYGDPLGYDAVRDQVGASAPGASAQQLIDALVADLDRRTGAAAPADDVTFVAVRVV